MTVVFHRNRLGFGRRARQLAVSAIGLLLVSGCAQSGQPILGARDRPVPLESTFVAPPVGGPQILHVLERRYPNATEQRILLANRSAVSGENFLEVRFFGPVGNSGTGRTELANRPVSAANIAREIRESVPGVPMTRSQLFVQNRYGPFGYAVGRAATGDVCVYAWQRIAGVDTSTILMRDRGTIEIRMRLCDRASGEERLLYSMYGFTIRAFFSNLSWNPYGAPAIADPRFGALGSTMLPAGARGFEPVIAPAVSAEVAPPQASRTTVRQRQAVQPVAVAAPVLALPAPVGPVVPPPPVLAAQPSATPASASASAAPAADTTPSVAVPAAPVAVPAPPPAAAPACTNEARAAGTC